MSRPIILFLDRNGFSIYQDTWANIPRFNFTPDVVANLDVINEDQLAHLVTSFIQINKVLPGSLVVILSDAIVYEKNLSNANAVGDNEAIQKFLENIPFEDVLAKIIRAENLTMLVAINKELVLGIADPFLKNGSVMEGIIPSFVFGQSANFSRGLTLDNVHAVLRRPELLKMGNLLTDQQAVIASTNSNSPPPQKEEKKSEHKRQYVLIVVFIILVAILGIVYFTMGRTPVRKTVATIAPSSAEPVLGKAQSLGPTLTVSPTSIDLKTIKIRITQNTKTQSDASAVRKGLLDLGFEDIVSEDSDTVPAKSSISFSKTITAGMREKILTEIKKTFSDINVLENEDEGLIIKLLVGRS